MVRRSSVAALHSGPHFLVGWLGYGSLAGAVSRDECVYCPSNTYGRAGGRSRREDGCAACPPGQAPTHAEHQIVRSGTHVDGRYITRAKYSGAYTPQLAEEWAEKVRKAAGRTPCLGEEQLLDATPGARRSGGRGPAFPRARQG